MKDNSITKDDLLKAFESFGKKIRVEVHEDMHKEILASEMRMEKRLEIKLDIKLEQMERRINDKARELNSEVLTRFDSSAGEIEKARIDRALNSDRLDKHQSTIDDHGKRIKKLEESKLGVRN